VSGSGRPPLRQVWRHREVRGLLLAQVGSDAGDQVARIALTLLVYDRSRSIVAASATLAVSFVPGFVATALLGSLADRFPRRAVMIVCDVLRAVVIGLLALVAVPGTPLLVLLALLLFSELATGPFASARAALYGDVLSDPNEFLVAQTAGRMVNLGMQVGGFILGGIVVQLLGPRTVLAFDAFTFIGSYLLIRTHVQVRKAVDDPGTSVRRLLGDLKLGVNEIMHDPLKRPIVLLSWVSTLYFSAPEAVAVGYHGNQSAAVSGLLLASAPAGSFVGAAILSRVRLPDQVQYVLPMAALSCVALFATSIDPPVPVAFALWFVAGAMTAFMITIIASVVQLTRPAHRGRVIGVAFAGFNGACTLAYLLVGWVAEVFDPARAVSLAGAVGLICVAVVRGSWRQDRLVTVLTNLAEQPVIDLSEPVQPAIAHRDHEGPVASPSPSGGI
jgi:MFS family permease